MTTHYRQPLQETISQIDALRSLKEGWNGYDVAAPNPDSIKRSHHWLRSMYRDAEQNSDCPWMDPHVSANEDGDVTFEWWNGEKKLTVYVSSTESWYIKIWGADVVDEMIDGSAESSEERQDIWAWLVH